MNIRKLYTQYFCYFLLYLISPYVFSNILEYFFGLFGLVIVLLFLPLKLLIVSLFALYITFLKKFYFYNKNIVPFFNIILFVLIILDSLIYISIFGLTKINLYDDIWFLCAYSFTVSYLPFYVIYIIKNMLSEL